MSAYRRCDRFHRISNIWVVICTFFFRNPLTSPRLPCRQHVKNWYQRIWPHRAPGAPRCSAQGRRGQYPPLPLPIFSLLALRKRSRSAAVDDNCSLYKFCPITLSFLSSQLHYFLSTHMPIIPRSYSTKFNNCQSPTTQDSTLHYSTKLNSCSSP